MGCQCIGRLHTPQLYLFPLNCWRDKCLDPVMTPEVSQSKYYDEVVDDRWIRLGRYSSIFSCALWRLDCHSNLWICSITQAGRMFLEQSWNIVSNIFLAYVAHLLLICLSESILGSLGSDLSSNINWVFRRNSSCLKYVSREHSSHVDLFESARWFQRQIGRALNHTLAFYNIL